MYNSLDICKFLRERDFFFLVINVPNLSNDANKKKKISSKVTFSRREIISIVDSLPYLFVNNAATRDVLGRCFSSAILCAFIEMLSIIAPLANVAGVKINGYTLNSAMIAMRKPVSPLQKNSE